MFGNEEIVRFESNQSLADLHSAVEDYLGDLGDATISKTGTISLASSGKYNGSFVTTEIYGTLKNDKNNRYKLILTYKCYPTILAWIIVIFGVLFCFLIGGCIALIPAFSTKNQLERDVRLALSNID